nr:hypothetical protein CFP56_10063 [Quercus suber]
MLENSHEHYLVEWMKHEYCARAGGQGSGSDRGSGGKLEWWMIFNQSPSDSGVGPSSGYLRSPKQSLSD